MKQFRCKECNREIKPKYYYISGLCRRCYSNTKKEEYSQPITKKWYEKIITLKSVIYTILGILLIMFIIDFAKYILIVIGIILIWLFMKLTQETPQIPETPEQLAERLRLEGIRKDGQARREGELAAEGYNNDNEYKSTHTSSSTFEKPHKSKDYKLSTFGEGAKFTSGFNKKKKFKL
jgi:hypothetical protein